MDAKTLYLIVPSYNEENVLRETAKLLRKKMCALVKSGIISDHSRICFVNDGSTDSSWDIINELYNELPSLFRGINLSRNRGHQIALLAGLMSAVEIADVTISIDADLQQDINAIDEMLEYYYRGFDIVYGIRNDRESDTPFKAKSATLYYRLLKTLGVDITANSADYRLMSRKALQALSQYREVHLFLRGLIPLIGMNSAYVYFDVHERLAGESKYTLRKMFALAIDGITSFSIKPLRFIAGLGCCIFFVSIAMLIYIIHTFFSGATVQGWASNAVSIWAIGGLILLSLGVIGEYIGKIYYETKARPRYIVQQYLGEEWTQNGRAAK